MDLKGRDFLKLLDFTPEEIELAMNHQVQPITLGKRILRTETAGMTVLSILMFLLEGKE